MNMTKLDILEVLEEAKEFLQYIDDILNKYDDDDAEILSDDLEEIDSWFRLIHGFANPHN